MSLDVLPETGSNTRSFLKDDESTRRPNYLALFCVTTVEGGRRAGHDVDDEVTLLDDRRVRHENAIRVQKVERESSRQESGHMLCCAPPTV